uniref:Uncharacterized protein n=1 Tax=Arundo donax TaxID=35708 RepID=A0A0A8Z6N4_ARUDO
MYFNLITVEALTNSCLRGLQDTIHPKKHLGAISFGVLFASNV